MVANNPAHRHQTKMAHACRAQHRPPPGGLLCPRLLGRHGRKCPRQTSAHLSRYGPRFGPGPDDVRSLYAPDGPITGAKLFLRPQGPRHRHGRGRTLPGFLRRFLPDVYRNNRPRQSPARPARPMDCYAPGLLRPCRAQQLRRRPPLGSRHTRPHQSSHLLSPVGRTASLRRLPGPAPRHPGLPRRCRGLYHALRLLLRPRNNSANRQQDVPHLFPPVLVGARARTRTPQA